MDNHLEINAIKKNFGGKQVLDNFSLSVKKGQFVVILGPSGCGKSTLLRIICGLESPESGTVCIGGIDIGNLAPRDRNIAMVFQNYALYPHKTVYQNLSIGLKLKKMRKAEIDSKVMDVSSKLGIDKLLDRKPSSLSGGEMQRVAVGRAMTKDPELFLFDEPLSNLDANLRNKLRDELRMLHQMLGVTTLYVTHDQVEAMSLGDIIVIINNGVIQQTGSPQEIFSKPENTFVAQFIGSPPMNILDVTLDGVNVFIGGTKIFEFDNDSFIYPSKMKLGIRPGDLEVNGKGVDCALESIDYHGSTWVATLKIEDQRLLVELKDKPHDTETMITIFFPTNKIQLFDHEKGTLLD
ncbi:MAG: hypothetical protein CL523_01675 [Actinomycetales bacterium]|nr:MAG: hypothetical protein CBE24_00150 [bacterium TMED264]PQM61879.1 MAG: hypothetical protein CL523_01675 [Actinomycetales bacterium]|tara:strand:- start:944 stop:1996 length:1053 start_codon:yes stop_codon:yes gene_type:complete